MKGPIPLLGPAPGTSDRLGLGPGPRPAAGAWDRVRKGARERTMMAVCNHDDTGPVGLAALTCGGAETPPRQPTPTPHPPPSSTQSQGRGDVSLAPSMGSPHPGSPSSPHNFAHKGDQTSPKPTSPPTVTPISPRPFAAKFLGAAAHTLYLQFLSFGRLHYILVFGKCRMYMAHIYMTKFLTPCPRSPPS